MKVRALGAVVALLTVGVGCASSDDAKPGGGDEGPDAVQDDKDLTAAKVTLRIPIIDENGKPLSAHNARLKAAGLGTFPDFVEIDGGTNGQTAPKATKAFEDAQALANDDKLDLGLTMVDIAEPSDYKTNDPATSICYKGNPLFVVGLIEHLTDSVFSDQLSIHGWRFRQKKVLGDGLASDDDSGFPSIWKNWRGQGNAVLTITASSDDGSEMNVGLIPRCAN